MSAPGTAKGHLIARQFGGLHYRENIVAMYPSANHYDGMHSIENEVRARLNRNERVFYAVIPRYFGEGTTNVHHPRFQAHLGLESALSCDARVSQRDTRALESDPLEYIQMPAQPECVQELVDLVGVPPGQRQSFDWPAVEASLAGGLRLPSDYKAMVEVFPPGRFAGLVRLIRPGDVNHPTTEYLGEYANQLDEMRNYRSLGHGQYPYPIYPEPDGLLPWAWGPRGELCFWLADSSDPDRWTVVSTDVDFLRWQYFPGTACEFLRALVTRAIGNPFLPQTDISPTAPVFEPTKLRPATASVESVPKSNTAPRGGRFLPHNDFAELAQATAGTRVSRQHDWAGLHGRLGLVLPEDYRSFVDHFGVGTFCDILIAGPDDPCGGHDFLGLQQAVATRAAASKYGFLTGFWPERAGLLPWGATLDGWTFHWRFTHEAPDRWSVAIVSPGMQPHFYDEWSFSTFLLKYASDHGVGLAREPWRQGRTFTPHTH